jgi:hypothetical protein
MPHGMVLNKKGSVLLSGRFSRKPLGFQPFEVRSDRSLFAFVFGDDWLRLGRLFENVQEIFERHVLFLF